MTRYTFPVAIIALNLGAAAFYLWEGDWRKVVYWAAAAVLTAAVTF